MEAGDDDLVGDARRRRLAPAAGTHHWTARGGAGAPARRPLGHGKNHGTQDSRVVPHRGTNWAVLWLTLQIGRDAVLSESYGRGCMLCVG